MSELEVLKSIELKLTEVVKWTRFAAMQQLRSILAQNLTDDKSLLAYEYSDGDRTTREIAKVAGTSHATITNYWEAWTKIGIAEPSPKYKGRFKRICSLEEVGLTVPPVPAKESEKGVRSG